MLQILQRWYDRLFSDPHAVTLFLILVAGFVILYFGGALLAPILLAMVLAYLLEWPVARMTEAGCPRTVASAVILLLFIAVVLLATFTIVPQIWQQSVGFFKEVPSMFTQGAHWLHEMERRYPQYLQPEQIATITEALKTRVLGIGQAILKGSLQSLGNLVTVLVYAVIVPLLMFFFLKDKQRLIDYVMQFIPSNRELVDKVWAEMNTQIVNYIRGKLIEIVIVGIVAYIFFAVMGLRYAELLGLTVGLSVLIPYIGATLATLPVLLVALFQWGWSAEAGYVVLGYGVIQALDGNVLVPLLFSEAVNLHPVAIISAVMIFGGLWGFWGVFFAIPLATLVKAVINAWPRGAATRQTD